MAKFMNRSGVDANLVEVLDSAVERGWKVVKVSSNGHMTLAHPSGHGLVTATLYPKDHHGIANTKATLLRVERQYGELKPPAKHVPDTPRRPDSRTLDREIIETVAEEPPVREPIKSLKDLESMYPEYPLGSTMRGYRDAVILIAAGGRSPEEIAGILGKSLPWFYQVVNDRVIATGVKVPGFSDDDILTTISHRAGKGAHWKDIAPPAISETAKRYVDEILPKLLEEYAGRAPVEKQRRIQVDPPAPIQKLTPRPDPTPASLEGLVALKNEINAMIDRLHSEAEVVSLSGTKVVVVAEKVVLRARVQKILS